MSEPAGKDLNQSAELLRRYRAGDERAATAIFERYAERLTRLAKSRLAAKLAARVEPEDIMLSAYRSFFVRARQGRFDLQRRGDLWRLLAEVTLHKLYRQAERHQAARRSVTSEERGGEDCRWLDLAAREPTAEQAAIAGEELQALLSELPARARPVVELRLQGYEQPEIAARLKCSSRTVGRWLQTARKILSARTGGQSLLTSPSAPPPRPRQRADSLPPQPGQLRWSDFVLKQQIGAGATGKVYRALERGTGRPVAIKFLKKALAQERGAIEQFQREVRTVAELGHPGIVAVEGIGRTPGGGYFLVMELVFGSDLQAVERAGPIVPSQAAAWVAAAANIVHAAHERGIIHCDLKPSNLLLDPSGNIRVTDFGLAVHLADDAPFAVLAGTPAFMAPEQVDACWGPLSPRTDVWGLGAALYFLLFGKPPHTGDNVAEVLALVVSGKPVSFPGPATRGSGPAQILDICRRCLRKRPPERYASAAELAAAIQIAGKITGG